MTAKRAMQTKDMKCFYCKHKECLPFVLHLLLVVLNITSKTLFTLHKTTAAKTVQIKYCKNMHLNLVVQ